MIAISSDALREGGRYALTSERFINIHKLNFKSDAVFHRAGEDKGISHTKSFSEEISQDELTWKIIRGIISFYDKKDTSLMIEGMVITPERVKELKLEKLNLKAVFVGFTEESYWESMIEYSNAKKDWIYKKINLEDKGDDSAVKKWFDEERQKNIITAENAKSNGYNFFSPTSESFDEYTENVIKHLLGN